MSRIPIVFRLLAVAALAQVAACAATAETAAPPREVPQAMQMAADAPLPLNRRLGAGVIRGAFNAQGARLRRAMEKHVPAVEVTSIHGLPYRDGDADAVLDLHFPAAAAATGRSLPVVVWIHGGAWLSGSRGDAAPFFRLLAAEGYVVVAPDYSLAPAATYPQPLRQLNALRAWLARHAAVYPLDAGRLFLAGDSAGAQLAAQLAAIGAAPGYAEAVGLPAVFTPDLVRGVVLHCGVFDLRALVRRDPARSRLLGWGTTTTVLAYARTRDPASPLLALMSPLLHVDARFPPAWITGGNADPLTPGHSMALAARLQALGVPVDALFWPDDHQPGLPHLYPFNLDSTEGQAAFQSMLAFLRSRD